MNHLYRFLFAVCLLLGGLQMSAGVAVPFTSSLDSQEELERWTTFDVDTNGYQHPTWYLGTTDYGGSGATSHAYINTDKITDNWLVSPAIALQQGGEYVITFKYFTAYYQTERLQVLLSTSPEPSADHTVVQTLDLRNYYGGSATVMMPAIAESGDYYISLRHFTEPTKNSFILQIKNFVLDVMKDGSLEGHAYTYVSGRKKPLPGAEIIATGPVTKSAMTDSTGYYKFDALPMGSYTMTWQKYGYSASNYPYSVEVSPGATSTYDCTIYPMAVTALEGLVTDVKGNPIPYARVTVDGYTRRLASTDAEGKWSVDSLYLYNGDYDAAKYTVAVDKNSYTGKSFEVSVRQNWYGDKNQAGTAALAINPLGASAPSVTVADTVASVSWSLPQDVRELSYDNGVAGKPLGYNGGGDTNILGTVFRSPLDLVGAKWYRIRGIDTTEPPANVNVYVVGLDSVGEPSGRLDGAYMEIPSLCDEWTTYKFDKPLSAPNGAVVGLNALGYVSIAKDTQEGLAPARTQVYSNSYVGGYTYFDEPSINWPGALMIRALAVYKEAGQYAPAMNYNVYRLLEADKAKPEAWTPVAEKLDTLTFDDTAFGKAPRGKYVYAVTVSYPDTTLVSEPVFTDVIEHRMDTRLVLQVTADSDPADAEGARITIDNTATGEIFSAAVAEGRIDFGSVHKGVWNLTLNHPGFELTQASLDIREEDEYTVQLTLRQRLLPPVNIDVVDLDGGGVKVMYDLFADFTEDFDGDDFKDFEINPAGARGWSYIDADGLPTYGFSGSNFPGMRSPMAAVVMNGSNTVPALTRRAANSGDRALAVMCASPTFHDAGTQLNHGNDYVISPRLEFHKPFNFNFWARTWEKVDGRLEQIRVGYSLGGRTEEDFIWLTGLMDVPCPAEETFTEFDYTVPAEARYVAIHSYSDDVFMLLLDDISFGTGIISSEQEHSAGKWVEYRIELDGTEVARTRETSFEIPEIEAGEHTVLVTKVFPNGVSEPISMTFSAVGNSGLGSSLAAKCGISYDEASRTLTVGEDARQISLVAVDGTTVMSDIKAGQPVSLAHLAPGVYVVRALDTRNMVITAKIAVR